MHILFLTNEHNQQNYTLFTYLLQTHIITSYTIPNPANLFSVSLFLKLSTLLSRKFHYQTVYL